MPMKRRSLGFVKFSAFVATILFSMCRIKSELIAVMESFSHIERSLKSKQFQTESIQTATNDAYECEKIHALNLNMNRVVNCAKFPTSTLFEMINNTETECFWMIWVKTGLFQTKSVEIKNNIFNVKYFYLICMGIFKLIPCCLDVSSVLARLSTWISLKRDY